MQYTDQKSVHTRCYYYYCFYFTEARTLRPTFFLLGMQMTCLYIYSIASGPLTMDKFNQVWWSQNAFHLVSQFLRYIGSSVYLEWVAINGEIFKNF